jgi:hypothetical protein
MSTDSRCVSDFHADAGKLGKQGKHSRPLMRKAGT